MNLAFKTRPLYPDELRLLKTLKIQKEKAGKNNIKFYHFVIAGILGTICTYTAAILPDSFWTFLFGTIAVFSFGFIVFTPYEIYKLKKRHKEFLKGLNTFILKGKVDTAVINATRIVVAKEYEDEGDLFIVEYGADRLLYLWDNNYNLKKKFPCLYFEIYEESYYKLIGRQIYSLSDRITPMTIDKKIKWKYMSKVGAPGHLETENKNLDELIEEYNNCA